MSLLIAAAILSCGLTAAPDGTPAPQGTVAMINAPIPDELARSLATRMAPEATIRFVGDPVVTHEWIIGLKQESDTRFMVARLSDEIFAYGVKIGWVDVQDDGTNLFTETSKGTCRVKDADVVPQAAAQ